MSIRKSPLNVVAKVAATTYGEYVVGNRALADIHDGLKPVQRRILWSMFKMGLHPDKGFRKSASVVGDVMGNYHPHGDAAIYGAMVNMANMPQKLIEPQGNFGGLAGPEAAQRYTEAKLSKFANDIFLNPDYLELVPKVPNYDNRKDEPVYLPCLLPNLLINGSSGIAYGVSANIPPFSADSVRKLCLVTIKKGKVSHKDCAKILKFNFNNDSQLLSSQKDVETFFKTGKAVFKFACKYKIVGKMMVVHEGTPYLNSSDKLAAKIEAISAHPDVSSVFDRSSADLNIEIVFKRGIDPVKAAPVIATKYLQENFIASVNYTRRFKKVFSDGLNESHYEFQSFTIPDLVSKWIDWRISLEKKLIKLYLERAEKELYRQQIYLLAVNKLNTIVKVLKSKPKSYDLALSKALKVSLDDAKMILDKTVRSLNALNKADIIKGISNLKQEIANLKKADSVQRVQQHLLSLKL